MDLNDVRNLYDYNTWANHRVLDSCAGLTDEQFTRNLGSSFPSVRDTLVHLFLVEWIWLERWEGRSPTSWTPACEFPNLEAVRKRWAEIERGLNNYISGMKAEDLARVIHHTTTKGEPQAAPHWQMLQHVVNHQTYHRGQVTTMLRQLGAKPASTDLIFFYRERAAQAKA
jgi:uncharacterized damage-inducible protein DinB